MGDSPVRAGLTLETPVAVLKGVGPRLAQHLERLGVTRIGELLCLLPIRYEDRTQIRPLAGLRPGAQVLVEGRVELTEVVFRRRRALLCRLADGSGAVSLRFFHFNRGQQQQLARGVRLRCFGDVRAGPTGLEMVHPEYRVLGAGAAPPDDVLTPVYPTTSGLSQQRLRDLIRQALGVLERTVPADDLGERLPQDWPTLAEALRFLHGPPPGSELELLQGGIHPCQRRVAFEELVAQRLSLRRLRQGRAGERAAALRDARGLVPALRSGLPYALTGAQERALEEILADMANAVPMHRLLQGDVGSGKTIVAAVAALVSASAGCQAAFMAPTELLAEQHCANLSGWLGPLGIEVVGLTGLGRRLRPRRAARAHRRWHRSGGGRHPRAVPGVGAL